MLAKFLLAALIGAGSGLPPGPHDVTAVPRVLVKEPVYRGTPKYALLVFGKNAATRVWMVVDGKTVYIDRNGNGDLTDPGEQQTGENDYYFGIDRLVERDGTVHPHLRVTNFSNGTFSLRLGGPEERQQYVGIGRMEKPSWGGKPADAPIIHFNGPLSLERYGSVLTLPRLGNEQGNRRHKLQLVLGTPGVGKGTFASYNDVCSENLGAVQADIEYPNADPKGSPLKQRVELKHDG